MEWIIVTIDLVYYNKLRLSDVLKQGYIEKKWEGHTVIVVFNVEICNIRTVVPKY